jgi:hypothetical protein
MWQEDLPYEALSKSFETWSDLWCLLTDSRMSDLATPKFGKLGPVMSYVAWYFNLGVRSEILPTVATYQVYDLVRMT